MWVKLHNKLLEWEWYGNPNMVALWVHLLLTANYTDRRWRGTTIKRGQLVTSLNALSEQVGVSIQQIRTCLNRLQETGEITNKSTNKYRIITICNYESYQQQEHNGNNQTTNNQQSNNNQITTPTEYTEYTDILSKDNIIESVVGFFNKAMAGAVIPQIRGCGGKRKNAVQARIREYGVDAVYEMITTASKSDFLNGANNRSWVASFDWLFAPTNFQKVLEGNYNGRENKENNEGADNPLSRARIHTAHIG